MFLHLLKWLYTLISHSIDMVYDIYWFAYIEASLHPRDKFHLITVYDLFNKLLNRFATISLQIFASMFVRDIGL